MRGLGSEVGSLSAMEIPGCNEDERCILKRGTNATVEIDFVISKLMCFVFEKHEISDDHLVNRNQIRHF